MRYTVFGLVSLMPILWKQKNIFKHVSRDTWWRGLVTTFFINICYYLGLSYAIRHAGSAISIIIVGLAPIAVLIHSNIKKKEISYSLLFAIISVIFLGIVLTNLSKFHSTTNTNPWKYLMGLCCAVTSTGIWVGYIVYNHQFLAKNPHITPVLWCHILGITSLMLCLPIVIICDYLGVTHITQTLLSHTPLSERVLFILLCGSMGIFSSSRAIAAWNKASLYLSPALLGALLIFEPIFGLILSYVCEQTLPSLQEAIGVLLMLGGSITCLILFVRKTKQEAPANDTISSITE